MAELASDYNEDSLTETLRKSSKAIHKVSDALVLSKLAVVCTRYDLYLHALSCFFHVHRAIEEALSTEQSERAIVALVSGCKEKIWRSSSFQKDLLWLLQKTGRSDIPGPQC
eukprot:jgi/Botrbrau1/23297/Bobra.0102s0038.1